MDLVVFWGAMLIYAVYLLLGFKIKEPSGVTAVKETVLSLKREDFDTFLLESLSKRETYLEEQVKAGDLDAESLELQKIQLYDEAYSIEADQNPKRVDEMYEWTIRKAKKEIWKTNALAVLMQLEERVYAGIPLILVAVTGAFNPLLFVVTATFLSLRKHVASQELLADMAVNATEKEIQDMGFTNVDNIVVSHFSVIKYTLTTQIPFLILYLYFG